MTTSQLGWVRAVALSFGAVALLVAAASYGGPGDRIDRFPFQLTGPDVRPGFGPQIAMNAAGGFVAAWATRNGNVSSIRFRRFAAPGTPSGDEVIVTSESSDRVLLDPRIAMADDGSVALIWWDEEDAEGEDRKLYAKRYGASDVALSEAVFVADEASDAASSHDLATAADGRFVVVWRGDPTGTGVSQPGFARLFDAAAVPLAPPFPAASAPDGYLNLAEPQVAMSATGAFVVVWLTVTEAPTSQSVLLGRRFDASGTQVGETFTVAQDSASTGELSSHRVAMSSAGEFAVVYPRYGLVPGTNNQSSSGVYWRRFDAAGTPLGGEFRASAAGYDDRNSEAVAVTAAGDMGITWLERAIDDDEPFMHVRLYRDGLPVMGDQSFGWAELGGWNGASAAFDGVGNFAVAFGTSQFGYLQRFAGAADTRPACARYIASVVGNNAANTLHGGAGHDVIVALGGNDTIYAWSGRDVICGGAGDDVIYAGAGNDHLVGGPGDDLLDGGRNYDYCNGETHTNADTVVSCERLRNVP